MRQQHEEQEEPKYHALRPDQAIAGTYPSGVDAKTAAQWEHIPAEPTPEAGTAAATTAEQVVMGRASVQARLAKRRRSRGWQMLHADPRRAALTGILASNGMALGVMLLTRWLFSLNEGAGGLFTTGEFVLLPMAMGGVCAYFWQEAKLSRAVYLLYGLLNTSLALLLSYVFLREGTICLLMASPLVLLFVLLGSFIGRRVFAAKHRQLNASLAPILLTLFVADTLAPHHFANTETDRLVIHAPPAQVWKYIVAYPANNAPPDYWLWRVGLPAPVQSIADGQNVGATRRCVFTGNIAFDERLTVVKPSRELMFDVTTQPNHPEIIGHFTLDKGRFLLEDNGDGTTTLTGTTWYRLNVYPICYYDAWTQDILRRVHLRVMHHIQHLAENDELKSNRKMETK